MKLSSDKDTMAELKALILYILYKINKPITNDEFLKLVLTITDINYFYFQQFLLDLMAAEYISSKKIDDNTLYKITPKGIEALRLTGDMIPGILKLKVDKNFKNELNIIENEVSVSAEYIPKNDKSFKIFCKITENGETVFEIRTLAGSSEHAKRIVDNWIAGGNGVGTDVASEFPCTTLNRIFYHNTYAPFLSP